MAQAVPKALDVRKQEGKRAKAEKLQAVLPQL